MDEMTLTLNNPITEEQWDAITDVDFENTDRVWFHTKHGKDVEFVKRKKGRWNTSDDMYETGICSYCNYDTQEPVSYVITNFNFCPNCGSKMENSDG